MDLTHECRDRHIPGRANGRELLEVEAGIDFDRAVKVVDPGLWNAGEGRDLEQVGSEGSLRPHPTAAPNVKSPLRQGSRPHKTLTSVQ